MEELSEKEKSKLTKYANHYKTTEKLLIAASGRKTIRYIEKNTINFPNEYYVLKNKIIDSCYSMLENIYRANKFQDIDNKKYNMLMSSLKGHLKYGNCNNLYCRNVYD